MITTPFRKNTEAGWWEFDRENQVGPSPPPPAYATFRRQTTPQQPEIPLSTLNRDGTATARQTPSAMEAQIDGTSNGVEGQPTQPVATRRKPTCCSFLYLILSITAIGLSYAHPHAPASRVYKWSNPLLGEELTWRQAALASIDRPTLWGTFLIFLVFCGCVFEAAAWWGRSAEVKGWRHRKVFLFGGLMGLVGGFLCAVVATL